MKKIGLIALLFIAVSTNAQNTVDSKFGKGIINMVAQDSSWSMKWGARFQTLYIGEWNINDSAGIDGGSSEFLIRRARLKFGGFAFSPKLKYKIELGLTNKDIGGASQYTNGAPRVILDAVLKWNFYKNFTLWGGQTKLPGNRERVVSSGNLQLVDRSMLNKNFNIDRDMGFQLRHHFTIGKQFLVREMISVSQGEGRNIVGDNLGGFQYTGRVELLPFGKFSGKGDYVGSDLKREESPKLALAVTYDYHDRAVKTKSNQGSYMLNDLGFHQTNVYTIFADAMFKYKGFSLMAEYANRTADTPVAVNWDQTETGQVVAVGTGMNFQVGYLFANNWELAGRYTAITLDKDITGKNAQTQYTLGVSKYVVGHKLKVQSDVSYLTTEESANSGLMYRLQFDIHF